MSLLREEYLQMIRPYYDADVIKVITGVRRAGKSVLLSQIRNEIAGKGVPEDHLIYLNLEDLDFDYISTAGNLNKEIKSRIRDKNRYYLFFDEIQKVNGFEKALASFRATQKVSIFVTGSNSTLLSGEMNTLLTGRTVEFEILPFSFYEMKAYYTINNRTFPENAIYDYIKWGGFPLRFDFKDEESVRRYLKNLYTGIVSRDILKKESAKKEIFIAVSLYILANAGKEFSAENIADYYNKEHKGRKNSFSSRTVYGYLEKMEKAFLIHRVRRYDISGKKALGSKEKFYAVDTGLRTLQTNSVSYEDTFFLENVVYNELVRRGCEVYIGKTYKGEVDFVAIKNGKKCFVQVSYLMESASTIKREFGAYTPIRDASPKYVLSLDKLDMSRDGIIHLNIEDFLLHKKELMMS